MTKNVIKALVVALVAVLMIASLSTYVSAISLDEIDESRMCKFFNEENNMWYIYDPVALTAYSFYLDDFVLDMYGMREWVESLPTKSISMVNLYMRYTIIGL